MRLACFALLLLPSLAGAAATKPRHFVLVGVNDVRLLAEAQGGT